MITTITSILLLVLVHQCIAAAVAVSCNEMTDLDEEESLKAGNLWMIVAILLVFHKLVDGVHYLKGGKK